MRDGYRTAARDSVSEFTEKKSRFISSLKCVSGESEAKAFIESVRKSMPDATHHCVAYRLYKPRIERFSDDGEPTGTAGMPMLEVLKKEDVYDLCVVVTRYFGGIMLGGGGLVRAYGRAAADALAKSGTALCIKSVAVDICVSYEHYGRVDKLISERACRKISSDFGKNVKIKLSVPECESDALVSALSDATGGSAEICVLPAGYDSF